MPLESATYISDLNSSNPAATDGLAAADDHLRLIKAALLATFTGINGATDITDETPPRWPSRRKTLSAGTGPPQGS
jgi:hypothetical protein